MPEPNLPPINLNSVDMDALRDSLPEMPDLTREALGNYNLRQQEIEIMVVSTWIRFTFSNRISSSIANSLRLTFSEIHEFIEFIHKCGR